MRLDKYLKVSRLIKRRTVANEACDNARVTVNGRPAKASYEVKKAIYWRSVSASAHSRSR
jgi:ribosomal 50S subunit-recycling heat shock protein